jgi:hypothetical protein
MAIDNDDDDADRCSTCSTECSCSMNRHGFFLVFIYIGRMENIESYCYYNEFKILILISQNNDNGHPSFH